MTADCQWLLQQALTARLAGDAGVQALIGNPVRLYDALPADPVIFPYVVIGEAGAMSFDTKSEAGMVHRPSVHSWSRYRGLKEIKLLMAAIASALVDAPLTIAGHHLVLIDFAGSDVVLDPDGLTRHGVQRFRALTQAV